MARRIAPIVINKPLTSGMTAPRPRRGSPPKIIVSMPSIIVPIAIIVTERGRRLNDSLSVLYQILVFIHQYNLLG